jgi:hypothetical protein
MPFRCQSQRTLQNLVNTYPEISFVYGHIMDIPTVVKIVPSLEVSCLGNFLIGFGLLQISR